MFGKGFIYRGGMVADKIPWCKFWTSCLTDPDLENLELHQWARWARLIIFLRAHGDNGKMRLDPPAISLQNTLRVKSYDELLLTIRMYKNVTLGELSPDASQNTSHKPSLSYMLICRNWWKYQGDSSKERMRKLRQRKPVTKYVTGDALDKSRVDLTSTSTSSAHSARSGAAPRSRSSQGGEMNSEDMEIAEANKAWKKPVVEKPEIKSYEDAKDDELCGPPKGMWDQVKKGIPK